MKRLLSILGTISVSATTGSTVIACQKNKIPISNVVPVTALGPISMANNFPTFAELMTAIQAKNPGTSVINGENIRLFGQPTSTSARIQGIREYQGFLTVTYTRSDGPSPVETDLSKLITTTNLGAITMANASQPTAEEILRGVIAKNPKAQNLTTNNFTTSNVSGTGATMTGTNGYTGTANVTYTRETNLTNIIKTTNLGKIAMAGSTPTKEELLAGMQAVNPSAKSLTVNDFQISGSATSTAATITGAGSYTGTVNLTYSAETDISKLITTTNLGAISMSGSTPTIDELLTAIKAKNPKASNLTNTTLGISGTASATAATVIGKTPYSGTVNLTYTKA